MYIVKLYTRQKLNFFLLVIFLILSIFINYKSGMIATPINLYGMFSGGFSLKDTLAVKKIILNGLPLNYSKYSYEKRDLMIGILDKYLVQEEHNKNIYETFQKVTQKLHLPINISSVTFTNQINNDIFNQWYAKLLTRICKKNIIKFEVNEQKYIWNGTALISVGTAVQIISYESE